MKWRDRDTLHELYVERGLSTRDIGDELGCSARTVCKWLRKCDIDARSLSETNVLVHQRREVPFRTYSRGYERWVHQYRGERETVRVHRLLAVAEYGFDAVQEMDVHHKNTIPWDNRPGNLELVDHAEHSRIHRAAEGSA